ncbi:MAG: outer membrane lipoprotein carrier protein LolA [Candidatus Sumerlaeia bacterium]
MSPTHRSIWPALLLLAVLAAPAALAADATTTTLTPSPTAATMALLSALESRHGADKTVYAEFSQIRHDESMDEDIGSTGSLWFRRNPDQFRCDYTNPQPMITIMTDQKLYMFTQEFNQVDYWQFESPEEYAQNMDTLMLGFGFKATDLARRYEIHSSEDEAAPFEELRKAGLGQDKYALLVFTPRPAYQEQSQFTTLKVFIDKAKSLPDKIWYQDPQGNTMRIQLRKIEWNVTIDNGRFSPKKVFPEDAKYFNKRDAI